MALYLRINLSWKFPLPLRFFMVTSFALTPVSVLSNSHRSFTLHNQRQKLKSVVLCLSFSLLLVRPIWRKSNFAVCIKSGLKKIGSSIQSFFEFHGKKGRCCKTRFAPREGMKLCHRFSIKHIVVGIPNFSLNILKCFWFLSLRLVVDYT